MTTLGTWIDRYRKCKFYVLFDHALATCHRCVLFCVFASGRALLGFSILCSLIPYTTCYNCRHVVTSIFKFKSVEECFRNVRTALSKALSPASSFHTILDICFQIGNLRPTFVLSLCTEKQTWTQSTCQLTWSKYDRDGASIRVSRSDEL